MEMGNLFLLMAIERLGKPAGPTCESGMFPVGVKSIFPLFVSKKVGGNRIRQLWAVGINKT